MNAQEMLAKSIEEIQGMLEDHRRVLKWIKEDNGKPVLQCKFLECPHKRKLREAVRDTIMLLDEWDENLGPQRIKKLRKKLLEAMEESDCEASRCAFSQVCSAEVTGPANPHFLNDQ